MLNSDFGLRHAAQHARELRDARLHTRSDVERSRVEPLRTRERMRSGERRRFRDIGNEYVVSRLRAVAEDGERTAIEHAAAKDRDHPCLAVWILARTIHVREANGGRIHPMHTSVI